MLFAVPTHRGVPSLSLNPVFPLPSGRKFEDVIFRLNPFKALPAPRRSVPPTRPFATSPEMLSQILVLSSGSALSQAVFPVLPHLPSPYFPGCLLSRTLHVCFSFPERPASSKAQKAPSKDCFCISHTNLLLLIIIEQPSTVLFTDFKCLIPLSKWYPSFRARASDALLCASQAGYSPLSRHTPESAWRRMPGKSPAAVFLLCIDLDFNTALINRMGRSSNQRTVKEHSRSDSPLPCNRQTSETANRDRTTTPLFLPYGYIPLVYHSDFHIRPAVSATSSLTFHGQIYHTLFQRVAAQ